MENQLLESVSAEAFARLAAAGGDPQKVVDPWRTVVVVYAAQGVIDNGGLRYFFGNDFPGKPAYSVFEAAYRTIGARRAADALGRATRLFGFADPELDVEKRREVLEGAGSTVIDELEGEFGEVWERMERWVEAERSRFGGVLDRYVDPSPGLQSPGG